MRKVTTVIDINAHIRALTCDIKVQNGVVTAIIGFENLAYGTITAIKFHAVGYNSFNDIVPINGKEKFFLIIQDIHVGINETAKDLKAVLPNPDIRKLDLEECQICYSNGSVSTYKGKEEYTYEFEAFDFAKAEEKEIREALEDKFGRGFVYKPQEYENGWICGCGYFNLSDSDKCLSCETYKSDAFSVCSADVLKQIVMEHHIAEEERKKRALKQQEQEERVKRQKYIKIGICAVVVLIFAIFLGHSIVMSGRTLYSSEKEMKEALQGKYTHYYDNGDAMQQIEIKGDQVKIRWAFGGDLDSEVKEWNYKKGTFRTFQTYTVLRNGDIKDKNGTLFEKGGFMPIDGSDSDLSSSTTSAYESGY
ncbi:hypothetical protein [Diplocloster agilis]|uniref:hypothetical protein n=1 Tax=Diplocloster agilis TaxID=2850323 RepID=UPI0008208734|nr:MULTISPECIES: hypothetical protein [Lachnospiraceae]MBU9746818.1 hypothetical protein [Diplocloster agilis]MCU6733169.1 hypothetical protein [Suonthocola fibrivorans]SCI79829.1 Uncharacterised protein [uncultured Clostridium sp.]